MTASVVLGILAIGLMNVWSVAGANVNDIVVREKAIWTLNAHMERLVALHQFTEFGATGIENSTDYGYPAGYSDDRQIFGANTDASMAPPGTLEVLKLTLGQANGFLVMTGLEFETNPGYPIHYVGGLLANNRRNHVWIDKDRDIVGRLSWETVNLEFNSCGTDNAPGGSDPCMCFAFNASNNGDRCREISLALEFPLRWNRNSNTVEAMPQATEIISLRTIVGRRR